MGNFQIVQKVRSNQITIL